MNSIEKPSREMYFFDASRANAMNLALSKLLDQAQRHIIKQYLSPENAYHLRHGRSWSHPGLESAKDAEMHEHNAETTTKFEAIVNHDLSEIDRVIGELTQAMTDQLTKNMYSTIAEACDESGNVVIAKSAGSTREAFAEILDKLEFGIDKDGNVQMPQIHAGSIAYRNLVMDLSNSPPDFVSRIESIKARKIAEAQDRERARKARFLNYGEEL